MPGLPEIDNIAFLPRSAALTSASEDDCVSNRAVVVGLGPAGQVFAHRAASRGWNVTAYDPQGKNLPSTIGLWRRQLPFWVPSELIAASCRPSIVLADGSSRHFNEEYVVLRNAALLKLGGYEVRKEAFRPLKARYSASDISVPEDGDQPDIIVDARGRFSAASVARDGSALPRQLAWGHIFSIDDIPLSAREAVLMDFRPVHESSAAAKTPIKGADNVSDLAAAEGNNASGTLHSSIPSFSYRIPLDEKTFLVEETILAIDLTDFSHREAMAVVKQRQLVRLKMLGIHASDAIDEEVVSFPLVRGSEVFSKGTDSAVGGNAAAVYLPIGVAGDWMNPATGYSVGAVFEGCDQTLNALERELYKSHRPDKTRPVKSKVNKHAVYQIRKRGLNALLSFNAQETADFFGAFFSLSEEKVMSYLIGSSLCQVLVAMASVAMPLCRRHPRLLAKLIKNFVGVE